MRAWTRGYDFYLPDRSVVTHLYIPSRSPLRPTFWQYEWGKRAKIQYKTMLRVNWLLGLHDSVDPTVSVDLINRAEVAKYGLGSARTAQQYWDWPASCRAARPRRLHYPSGARASAAPTRTAKGACRSFP